MGFLRFLSIIMAMVATTIVFSATPVAVQLDVEQEISTYEVCEDKNDFDTLGISY